MPSIGELVGTVTLEDKFSGELNKLADNAARSVNKVGESFAQWQKKSETQLKGFQILLASGQKDLEGMGAAALKVGASFERMSHDLSGKDIVLQATMAAEAVRNIGGISKLTESELTRLSKIAQEAAAKLTAMGKDVPAGIKAIADATGSATKATETWYSRILETAAGFALWDAAKTIIRGVASAIEGLATKFGTLILNGAKVDDLTGNFDHLTQAAGKLGSELLGALQQGTHNTVDNLTLMKTVNKDLSAGLNLTAEQFKTLAKGAFSLAQATGSDVAGGFETMNRAMLTGQTRAIALLTGHVDLEKAQKRYADSIGLSVEQLTEEMKLQAKRQAILEAVGNATQRLGEQTDGIDEFVDQATTAWTNFQNELGRTLASNPVLLAGLQSLRDSFVSAFGDDQKTLVENVNTAITNLALRVPDLIDYIVQFGVTAARTFDEVQRRAGGLGDALRHISVGAAAGGAMGAFAGGVGALPGMVIGGVVGAMAPFTSKDTGQASDGLKAIEHAAKTTTDATAAMRQKMQEAAAASHTLGSASVAGAKGIGQLGSEAELTSDKLSKVEKAANKHKEAVDSMVLSLQGEKKNYDILFEASRQLIRSQETDIDTKRRLVDALDKVHAAEGVIPDDIEDWRRANEYLGASQDKVTESLKKTMETVVAMRNRAGGTKLMEVWDPLPKDSVHPLNYLQGIPNMAKVGKDAEVALSNPRPLIRTLKADFAGFGDMLIQSLMNGGGVSGAMKAFGSKIGKDIGEHAGKALGDFGSKIGGSLGKMLGGVASFLGPLGSLLGPTIEKVFGVFTKAEEKAVNKTREDFVQTFGAGALGLQNLSAVAVKATGSLALVNNLLKAKNAEDYKKAVDALNGALAKQNELEAKQKQLVDLKLQMGDKLLANIDAIVAAAGNSKADLDAVGNIAVASFNAAIAAGKSFAEAIDAAGPGLSRIYEAYEKLGIPIDNAALKILAFQGQMAKNNPGLIQGVAALASSFSILDAMGQLNDQTFADMEHTITSMFSKMQGEAAKGGGSIVDIQRNALIPMQDALHAAEDAAKKLGIPLDENTQILIDQSKELGIWKDKGKTATDIMIDLFKELNKTIDDLARALRGLPPRTDLDLNLHRHEDGPSLPDLPSLPDRPKGDDPLDPNGPRRNEARGGVGYAAGPMTFRTQGDEQWAFSSEGKSFKDVIDEAIKANGGGGSVVINNKFDMNGVLTDGDFAALVETRAMPVIVRQIQNNTNGVKTIIKEDLGVS